MRDSRKLLDATKTALTYDGWRRDMTDAEETAVNWPTLLDVKLEEMKRKQQLAEFGRNSFPELRALDAIKTTLTYDGWQYDVADAEANAIKWPNLFKTKLETINSKQLAHEGQRDRHNSTTTTLAQESLRRGLTDPGESAIERPTLFSEPAEMKRKQMVQHGQRYSQELQALDTIKKTLKYDGWQRDVADAEEAFIKWPTLFNDKLEQMKRSQQLAECGRSSFLELRLLDAIKTTLTYDGWQQDVADADETAVKWPTLFNCKLDQMRCKQHSAETRLREQPRRRARTTAAPNICAAQGKVSSTSAPDSNICVVCMDALKTHIYVPCGHLCVCESCSMVSGQHCPVCRSYSSTVLRVFA